MEWKVKTDVALVELDDDLGAQNGHMVLYAATDTQLDTTLIYNAGFPEHLDGLCYDGGTTLYRQTGWVKGHNSVRIKTELDGSQGLSGSPLYICPANDPYWSEAGETGGGVGVLTHIWVGTSTDVRGPRTNNFLTWAQGVLP